MSERASRFVREWISAHVHSNALIDPKEDPRREDYVAECLAAAQYEGITREEIEEACGDLHAVISEAIDHASAHMPGPVKN